jgi:hypothetical protein
MRSQPHPIELAAAAALLTLQALRVLGVVLVALVLTLANYRPSKAPVAAPVPATPAATDRPAPAPAYRAVFHAMACPGGWLPWELMQTPENTTPAEAHMVARSVRRVCPADLVAVRPADGSHPVWPEAMADHYDIPPYSDQ